MHRNSHDRPRTERSKLPAIPVSPNATPRKCAATRTATPPPRSGTALQPDSTPTKVPLKDVDGPSPNGQASLRRRETDTDTLVSDRLSVMSFAFKGADQIRPVQRRVRAPTAPTNGITTAKLSNARSNGHQHDTALGPKLMTSSAANAKFANRLRSPDEEHDTDKDATIRPHSSKTRRSLPPAMALQPSTNLPEQSLRNGSLLNPPRIVSSSGHRGVKGSTAPVSGNGRAISAATAKRLSMKAEQRQNREVTPDSPVPDGNDSTMALWAAYGAANGSESTPRRVVAGRQMGGRI